MPPSRESTCARKLPPRGRPAPDYSRDVPQIRRSESHRGRPINAAYGSHRKMHWDADARWPAPSLSHGPTTSPMSPSRSRKAPRPLPHGWPGIRRGTASDYRVGLGRPALGQELPSGVRGERQGRARNSAQLLVHVVVAHLDIADARMATEGRLQRPVAESSRLLVSLE
jgi:hypothetical protein